ncbi:MAG: DUF3667 domain-containing protein [Bacteroidota bacterium]
MDSICPNCEAPLKALDNYCPTCGQRKLPDNPYAIGPFLRQFFHHITHLDGKFLRTFGKLWQPGHLTQAYFAGRRMRYLLPLQFFLLMNLFYFLAFWLSEVDTFDYPLFVMVQYLPFSEQALELVVQHLGIPAGTSEEESWRRVFEFAPIYDQRMRTMSKTLMLIFIPFLALVSWPLYARKKPFYGQHLIFSAHLMTFVLVWMATGVTLSIKLLPAIMAMLGGEISLASGQWNFVLSFYPAVFIYLWIASRRVFQQHGGWITLKSLILIFFLSQMMMGYNYLLFRIILWTD